MAGFQQFQKGQRVLDGIGELTAVVVIAAVEGLGRLVCHQHQIALDVLQEEVLVVLVNADDEVCNLAPANLPNQFAVHADGYNLLVRVNVFVLVFSIRNPVSF